MRVLSLDDALVRKARKMPSVTTERNYLRRTYLLEFFLTLWNPVEEIISTNKSAQKTPPDYMWELVFCDRARA